MNDAAQMALGIGALLVLLTIVMTFVGPRVTPYSRKQWALLIATLVVLWVPMVSYLIFIVGPSKNIDPRRAADAGALNLGIGVPVFILIAKKWILKRRN